MRIVVVGCGFLGASLAERLSVEKRHVLVIDSNEAAFAKLSPSFAGQCCVGDPMTSDVLSHADARWADILIAATPNDDLNIVIGVTAQKAYGVGQAFACVRNPKRADSPLQLGVTTFCPTTLEAEWIAQSIERRPHPKQLLHAIVVGCGELGSLVARRLSHRGHRVVIIDRRERSLVHLPEDFGGQFIVGDAEDPLVLERARGRETDLLIATTRNDVVNLTVALGAKQIVRIEDIIIRVQDPGRERLFQEVSVLPSTAVVMKEVLTFISR